MKNKAIELFNSLQEKYLDKTGIQFPAKELIVYIAHQGFQSNTFKNCGYNYMPDVYGIYDRENYLIHWENQEIKYDIFMVIGKISSNNPFEVGHAMNSGLDMRKTLIHIYYFDWNSYTTTSYNSQTGVKEVLTNNNQNEQQTLWYSLNKNLNDLGTPYFDFPQIVTQS